MAEVKWIKLTTDMFDNRKIKHLRKLPEGNSIVLIWVMLLTMAGRCNAGGMIFLTENIPYTPKMLADELGFEENTVKLALEALERFNMIVADNGFFAIAGWEEHQNIESLEKIRESKRLAQARWRAKKKALPAPPVVEPTVESTRHLVDDAEEDTEEEKDKELDRDNIPSGEDVPPPQPKINYQQVIDLFNNICKSLPAVRKMTDARKAAIRSRLRKYNIEDFKTVFEKAESSSFLRGEGGGWKASFDWLIKESNMVKVMEDNYADKGKRYGGRKEQVPGWFKQHEPGEAEMDALNRLMGGSNNTEDFSEEAEQLRKELQASFGKTKEEMN